MCLISGVQATFLHPNIPAYWWVFLPSWVSRTCNGGNFSNIGSHEYDKCPQNVTQLCPGGLKKIWLSQLWKFHFLWCKRGVWPSSEQQGMKRHLLRGFWERFLGSSKETQGHNNPLVLPVDSGVWGLEAWSCYSHLVTDTIKMAEQKDGINLNPWQHYLATDSTNPPDLIRWNNTFLY